MSSPFWTRFKAILTTSLIVIVVGLIFPTVLIEVAARIVPALIPTEIKTVFQNEEDQDLKGLQPDDELGYKFREQFEGELDTILTESKNGKVMGRSSRYFYVNITNNSSLNTNELVKVKLIKNLKTEMTAKVTMFQ